MRKIAINTIEEALQALIQGNKAFVAAQKSGSVLKEIKPIFAVDGQQPYAVVVTCSDSRVPAEYIFSAGIGDLFVIRTAGHVIGEFELGSIEYGVKYLGAKVVLVLGHNHCGAVRAAMGSHGHDYVKKILDEIIPVITGEEDVEICEKLNIENSVRRIMASDLIKNEADAGRLHIAAAKYDIESGTVEFF
ncbi:carbonic anhydrase [Acetobacterium sp.]|jgi:carbonic anhydrase|uniref:carbonic anhydrase n=1 Tax=Acetobacterium sp. TaxID=1872094 RepID=UPI000CBB0C18|nr:carbonic anhydrase [Acetobacterium sp.]MDO9492419.1 carbonic anhydrase [Acetobacterium sp.]PKM75681.1 MAG: carbonic anhydrase [Firmicutes bacterium HGW-Firmicutes-17]